MCKIFNGYFILHYYRIPYDPGQTVGFETIYVALELSYVLDSQDVYSWILNGGMVSVLCSD